MRLSDGSYEAQADAAKRREWLVGSVLWEEQRQDQCNRSAVRVSVRVSVRVLLFLAGVVLAAVILSK